MTFDENNNIKNIKNNNLGSDSNINLNENKNSLSNNSNNLVFGSIDEKLYDEVEYISNALNDGSLKLTPDEESKLKKDLDLILSNIEQKNQEYNNSEEITPENFINDNEEMLYDSSDSLSVEDMYVDSKTNNNEFILNDDAVLLSDEDLSLENDINSEYLINEDNSLELLHDGMDTENVVESQSVDDALSDLIYDYSNEVVIKVNNVSMEYKLSQDKIDTLKEFFIRTIKRNKGKTKTITALKNISFEIPKGDRVGIIGFNGAGKSTLLKLLSRVYDPTEGTIETKGKIAPLLELGAGFDNNYTGKANIFLNGAFLGYSEDFIKEKYDEIVEFSELGDAINYHVKTYSSGMRAKLGFSIATIVEPDILIIDEILSVGDIKFRRKSSDKIRSLINSGITVLLVSHTVSQIRELCNKAIWIDDGEIKMMGEVNKVCDAYVKAAEDASQEQLKNIELH